MSKHTFFATRPNYRPSRAPAQGMVLMVQRGSRSPLLRWPEEITTPRAKRAQPSVPESPGRHAVVEDLAIDPVVRSFELCDWNLDVVTAFDGNLTGAQVFELPHVQRVLPGATREAKLEAFGSFLQELAANELLLFEL